MQGNWGGGGRSCPLLPFFRSRSQRGERGSVRTTRCLVRAPLSLPVVGGGQIFIQTGACESHTPPPFLFVSNGGGVNPTRRPPFFSISNGGGVWHSRHPPVSFHFARGQRESYTLPLVSFRFEQGQCESHTLPPVSLCFEQGQCESHMPPLFLFLYPQWWGGI